MEQTDLLPKTPSPSIKSRFSFQPPRWAQAVVEKGPEQALPLALVIGVIVSFGSFATSVAMLAMHIPVHTVLCRDGAACYPNFFLTTWLMMFAASGLSGSFYTFLCMQQQQLRLRQNVAMLGSCITMILWLSTIAVGFLPTQVGFDSNNSDRLQVRAFGMLSSSIQNYQIAHSTTRLSLDGGSSSASPQVIWIVGNGAVAEPSPKANAGPSSDNGNSERYMVAAIYRALGDVNKFYYNISRAPIVNVTDRRDSVMVPRTVFPIDVPLQRRTTEREAEEDGEGHENGDGKAENFGEQDNEKYKPPSGREKMNYKHQPVLSLRSEAATSNNTWNIYQSKTFYKDETRTALAATIFAPLSVVLSFVVFLLLSAFPFI